MSTVEKHHAEGAADGGDVLDTEDCSVDTQDITPLWKEVPDEEVLGAGMEKMKMGGMAFLHRRGMPRTCMLMGVAGLVIYAVYLITPLLIHHEDDTPIQAPDDAHHDLQHQHHLTPGHPDIVNSDAELSSSSLAQQPPGEGDGDDVSREQQLKDAGLMEMDGMMMMTEEAAQALHHTIYTNISHVTRPPYLSTYKNPCWVEHRSCSQADQYGAMPDCIAGHMTLLRCLPYFMASAAPHSGLDNLNRMIRLHHQVALYIDETPPNFWSKFLYHKAGLLGNYIGAFDRAAREIKRRCSQTVGDTCDQQFITGDISKGTFYENHLWRALPGNRKLEEPAELSPHLIARLYPEMKIILLLRDPIKRLYAEYVFHSKDSPSPHEFHRIVLSAIRSFETCLGAHPVRACVYYSEVGPFNVALRLGLYAHFVEDWLSAFPRSQILPILYEDYNTDYMTVIKEVTNFLDIEAPSGEYKIFSDENSPRDVDTSALLPETLSLLTQFYGAHNLHLPKLLQDDRFKWQ